MSTYDLDTFPSDTRRDHGEVLNQCTVLLNFAIFEKCHFPLEIRLKMHVCQGMSIIYTFALLHLIGLFNLCLCIKYMYKE